MTKVTFASHPNLLGFEELDRLVERIAKGGSDGYPPWNIEQTGSGAYRITLAVAGFACADSPELLRPLWRLVTRNRRPPQ